MSPSISVRDSIRFLPQPADEPTRTVVLTSPENRFVDIRILRPPPDTKDLDICSEDHIPLDHLDWAFAGISSSTISPAPQTGHIAHSKWDHWVDSRHLDTENVSDEGDMYALADGRTLEKGSMINPATGVMTDYEEIWRDVEPVPTEQVSHSKGEGQTDSSKDRGTSVEGGDQPKRATCTVLVLQHDGPTVIRGMVIQLGQFCQGVLRYGDQFSLERWIWDAGEGWKREVGMGADWVPCGVLTGGAEKVPEIGGTVKFGGLEWMVVEKGHV